ncbi:pyridoxine biosynthesis protein [Trapelia coarctata]|nr:pyridoxine biosynthesis protein [Trapelia coarctata]
MSPTMTEGNIASWKVKEGDSFSTGDVLLEIETDKAQMDVEAQDDGIVAKITQPDGTKGVKVGSRIAVLAEPDDDLSTLSIPEETSAPTPPKSDSNMEPSKSKSSPSQAEASDPSKGAATTSSDQPKPDPSKHSSGTPKKQTYPLYPSVAQLLHEKGIPLFEADNIPASGPKGRLLKGDVLAYVGAINSSYSSEQSARISKLGHLDLSNVKIATPPKPATPPPTSTPSPALNEPEPDTEIAVSISFKAVKKAQERIQKVLGVSIPLETFVARAVELSNTDLPRSKSTPPTQDELFNQVLGLNNVSSQLSHGSFTPQIVALPSIMPTARKAPTKKQDIIDILAGKPSSGARVTASTPPPSSSSGTAGGSAVNVFSVSVSKGEEQRAKVFLERVKTILQIDPGRLVL